MFFSPYSIIDLQSLLNQGEFRERPIDPPALFRSRACPIIYRAERRKVVKSDEDYQLREQQASYIVNSIRKKVTLSDDNTYLWNVSSLN